MSNSIEKIAETNKSIMATTKRLDLNDREFVGLPHLVFWSLIGMEQTWTLNGEEYKPMLMVFERAQDFQKFLEHDLVENHPKKQSILGRYDQLQNEMRSFADRATSSLNEMGQDNPGILQKISSKISTLRHGNIEEHAQSLRKTSAVILSDVKNHMEEEKEVLKVYDDFQTLFQEGMEILKRASLKIKNNPDEHIHKAFNILNDDLTKRLELAQWMHARLSKSLEMKQDQWQKTADFYNNPQSPLLGLEADLAAIEPLMKGEERTNKIAAALEKVGACFREQMSQNAQMANIVEFDSQTSKKALSQEPTKDGPVLMGASHLASYRNQNQPMPTPSQPSGPKV